jgi:hypothetical protein
MPNKKRGEAKVKTAIHKRGKKRLSQKKKRKRKRTSNAIRKDIQMAKANSQGEERKRRKSAERVKRRKPKRKSGAEIQTKPSGGTDRTFLGHHPKRMTI